MMNGEPFFFVVENFSSQKMICNQEQGVLFISIHLMSCLWRDIFASAGKKWINERRTKRKGSKTTPVYALRRRHAQNKFYDVQHQKTSSIQRYNAQAITGKEHLIRFKSISINSFSFALRRDRKKIPYRLCFAVKSKKKNRYNFLPKHNADVRIVYLYRMQSSRWVPNTECRKFQLSEEKLWNDKKIMAKTLCIALLGTSMRIDNKFFLSNVVG